MNRRSLLAMEVKQRRSKVREQPDSELAEPSAESGEENGSPPISPSNGQAIESNETESQRLWKRTKHRQRNRSAVKHHCLLDSSPVIADLGSGVSAPDGRLEFRSGMDLFCVTLGDGSLGVASQSGSMLISLGAGMYPIWSPLGSILLYSDVSSGASRIMTWDSETGNVYPGGVGDDRTYNDTPAGWSGERYYYQRTFPESARGDRVPLRDSGMDQTIRLSGPAAKSTRFLRDPLRPGMGSCSPRTRAGCSSRQAAKHGRSAGIPMERSALL